MSLPSSPHSRVAAGQALKLGAAGWPVYALQTGLNAAGTVRLTPDGAFGQATERALKAAQLSWGLKADGVSGPATRVALTRAVCQRIDKDRPALPDGLLRGMAESEGGNNPAAVNPDIPGGVDCGLWQYRCYGPAYEQAALRLAFDPYRSGLKAADDYLKRRTDFAGKGWTGKSVERASRCAAMAHNWPAAGGASVIAQSGRCSFPDSPCSWLPRREGKLVVKFPDGRLVQTRWEWCQFYAMGGPHGEGTVTKYVTSWA